MSSATIAVIEDDADIRELIVALLEREEFTVHAAASERRLMERVRPEGLDLLILDLMLPGEDGLEICHRLRVGHPRLPILIVTAKGDPIDKIIGLELGADDYLAKPFDSRELLARVRAILRRARGIGGEAERTDSGAYRFSGWTLVVGGRELLDQAGQPVSLTSGEFDLLHALVEHPQRVLTRDQLIDWTRGRSATPFDRTIDVQLSRLRRKLGDDARHPSIIRTIRGDGYLFAPNVVRC